MSLTHYLSFLTSVVQFLYHSLVDISVLLGLVLYVAAERKRSLIMTVVLTGSILLCAVITLLAYSYIRDIALARFMVSENIATVIGMGIILAACILIFFLTYYVISNNISSALSEYRFLLGTIILGTISYVTIFSLVVTILLVLPVPIVLKDFLNSSSFIRASASGITFVEEKVNNFVGKGPFYTALTVTVKLQGEEKVPLNFSTDTPITISKQQIVTLINNQRIVNEVPALQDYPNLDQLAIRIAKQFANAGYLSRNDIQRSTLFDILDRFDITYQSATMLVSYAQNEHLAVSQWMNIPFYKQIITHPEYAMLGSGAVRVASYGNIYVLIFLK